MNHLLCIAPMLDRTDRHYRYFIRLITRHTLLYTEMITTGALLHGDADYHLKYNDIEHPLALQLGGSEPAEMAQCAAMAEDHGYDEVNINVGCPSDRVQSGRFGACLMAEPDLVAECVAAMKNKIDIPVTVKSRTGIDHLDSYEALQYFVSTIHQAGCNTFIIHARKAWLKGLSPKENREIPPLQYDLVYQLKQDFPQLEIIINGGIKTLDEVEHHLKKVDGVMIGREAYSNPWILSGVDQRFYADKSAAHSRAQVIEGLLDYIEQETRTGTQLNHITRHILGLAHGQPGARKWRHKVSSNTVMYSDIREQLTFKDNDRL
ncbi:MAG: tRNA dihydrouridine(20/20a) synthase DusA [Gammaproteobacteria bacterium]|nr:MAG: tRNA dihydrouridine(20/20a) synthase DusA [Gammaproteobacteria bacterium]